MTETASGLNEGGQETASGPGQETASGPNEGVQETASGLNEGGQETASGLNEGVQETVSGPVLVHVPATSKKCLHCCVEKSLCECYFGGSYFNADGKEI